MDTSLLVSADKLVEEGNRYLSRGRFSDSKIEFIQALNVAPGYYRPILGLAFAECHNGNQIMALPYLREAARHNPGALHIIGDKITHTEFRKGENSFGEIKERIDGSSIDGLFHPEMDTEARERIGKMVVASARYMQMMGVLDQLYKQIRKRFTNHFIYLGLQHWPSENKHGETNLEEYSLSARVVYKKGKDTPEHKIYEEFKKFFKRLKKEEGPHRDIGFTIVERNSPLKADLIWPIEI